MPDESKPPADQTGTTEPKGVHIVGRKGKGVEIIDKNSKTGDPPPLEMTDEEYIAQQTGGPC